VFYGWVVVAVMGAVGALSMALGGLNFGLFIKPLGDDLGVGRAVFGWSQSARSIASAATAPLIGGLIDRFGARVLLAVAAAMTGVALIGLGSVTAGWQIIALYALMGVVGMSGPGSLVTTVPVTKWFVRRRGLALSMMSLGVPVGGLLFVPLTQILIDAVGWRQAWVILALLGAGLILPLALVFVRREPEDMGLLPDGGPVAAPTGLGLAVVLPDERSWTRAEAMRSGAFWRLVVAFSIVQMAISSVGVHRIASFMDRGRLRRQHVRDGVRDPAHPGALRRRGRLPDARLRLGAHDRGGRPPDDVRLDDLVRDRHRRARADEQLPLGRLLRPSAPRRDPGRGHADHARLQQHRRTGGRLRARRDRRLRAGLDRLDRPDGARRADHRADAAAGRRADAGAALERTLDPDEFSPTSQDSFVAVDFDVSRSTC
jgi:hypothetical protein